MVQTAAHNFFELLGVMVCIGLICLTTGLFITWIEDKIRSKIYDYRMKHRFDKPPTAKCYCIDCEFHNIRGTYWCHLPGMSRATPDFGFCYEARPREKEA